MAQILICTDLKYFFKNMYVNQISEYFFFPTRNKNISPHLVLGHFFYII